MTRYVAGFLFAEAPWGASVALIRKSRPEWQRGRCNGVGGKVEEGETYAQAMAREFAEETGVHDAIDWREYAALTDRRGWTVHFFRATAPIETLWAARDRTVGADEPIEVWHVSNIPAAARGELLPNLAWLIPMAMDPDVGMVLVVEGSA